MATIHNISILEHPWGGFGFGINNASPCKVTYVSSQAAEAGLRVGDSIFAVNGVHLFNQPSSVVASFVTKSLQRLHISVLRAPPAVTADSGIGTTVLEDTKNATIHVCNNERSKEVNALKRCQIDDICWKDKKQKMDGSVDSRRIKKWKIRSVRNFYSSQHTLDESNENQDPSILNQGMLLSTTSSFKTTSYTSLDTDLNNPNNSEVSRQVSRIDSQDNFQDKTFLVSKVPHNSKTSDLGSSEILTENHPKSDFIPSQQGTGPLTNGSQNTLAGRTVDDSYSSLVSDTPTPRLSSSKHPTIKRLSFDSYCNMNGSSNSFALNMVFISSP